MNITSEQPKPSPETVWPPPVTYPAPTIPVKPPAKSELMHVRWRWLWTLSVPLMVAGGLTRYSEHSLRGTLVFGFDVLMFSAISVKAWRLKARFDRDGHNT